MQMDLITVKMDLIVWVTSNLLDNCIIVYQISWQSNKILLKYKY